MDVDSRTESEAEGGLPVLPLQIERILRSSAADAQMRLMLVLPEQRAKEDNAGAANVAAPVVVRGQKVAEVRAAGDQTPSDLMRAAAMAATRLEDAWLAAEEIENLASEIVHAYEELHLLYDLSEALTGQLSVASAADVILDKVLQALHGAAAELVLDGPLDRRFTVTAQDGDSPEDLAGGGELEGQRLSAPVRGGGQRLGSLSLFRAAASAPFSSADEKLIDAVGMIAGNAIHNALLYEELRRQTDVLREREEHLRAVMDNVADGIVTIDENGKVQSLNPAAEHIFGYQASQVVGEHFSIFFADEDGRIQSATVDEYLHSLADGAHGSEPAEGVGRRSDGGKFPVDVAIGELRTTAQHMHVLSVRDATERKRSEEALGRTERLRALGQLASGVAHDLNQSLGLIAGYSDLAAQALNRTAPSLNAVREALSLVSQAAMDGGQTVQRLLLFARAQPDDATREVVDMLALLRDIGQLTAPRWRDAAQAEGRPITLTVTGDADATIAGWPSHLREAYTNLVLNAVDAMPHGGRIELSALRSGQRVEVAITDTGVGMSREVQARVFEPFFSTKGARGTGLGLAIVFGVVERHEGTISIESAPGAGTTFHLSFPATAPKAAAPAIGPSAAPATRALRVLAVDDEPALAEMVSHMLAPDGHQVTTAPSGEMALQRLEAAQFDLVISDVGMGAGMNGWDLAQHVQNRWPEVRFVLATGWGAQISAEEARAKGVEAVVPKPYRMSEMRALVAEIAASLTSPSDRLPSAV